MSGNYEEISLPQCILVIKKIIESNGQLLLALPMYQASYSAIYTYYLVKILKYLCRALRNLEVK